MRLRRRRELLCVAVGAEVGEQERVYSFHFYSCPSSSLDAFSATPPASEMRTVVCPRVPPRSARVSPAVKHGGAPPPEAWATLCCCGSGGGRAGESIQFPLLFLSESLPRRFQCDASGVGSENCCLSTGSPSLWLGYHPRLSIVRLRRRRE